jgi:phosphoglycerate dehydrogenase-like enzyme
VDELRKSSTTAAARQTRKQASPIAVVVDPDEVDFTPGRRILEAAGFEVRVGSSTDPAFGDELAHGATALIVGYTRVDRALLDSLRNLGIVATMSAGVDSVDLHAARARGLWVTNVPTAAGEEVATHAFALALALVRRIPFLDRHVRDGGWAIDADENPQRPSTLAAGIVGLGRIGRRVATLAEPVFGRVVGHDPNVGPEAWPVGVHRRTLDELLEEADVVLLHLPGMSNGEPLLDARRIASMRPGSMLVNVSRGSLVDLPALLSALDSGHLTGAALDVLPLEPPTVADPVRRHPRVVLTPHLAYLSQQSALSYVTRAADNVVAWARTGRPLDVVVEAKGVSTPRLPRR